MLCGAIALASFTTTTFAQKGSASSDPGITYGVKAGVTIPSISTVLRVGEATNSDSSVSFYVGGIVDIPVASILSVQPGVSLVGKGGKQGDITQNLYYIEVPVNLVAKMEAGPGKIFVGAGPYLALGVGGNNGVKFGENAFNPIDLGVNFMLGYQMANGFSVNGGYGLGFSDVFNGNSLGAKGKNRVISVGLGFNF